MKAVGVLTLAALGGCGPTTSGDPEPIAGCYPDLYRGTCIGELALELYRTCFDGAGACTWSEDRNGGVYHLLLEWENGARYETMGDGANAASTTHAASGERCTLQQIATPECRGIRFSSSERWYEYCVEVDATKSEITGFRYTCDTGEHGTLEPFEPTRSAPTCVVNSIVPIADCVDAQGRRLADRDATPREPDCKGAACGDIASYCSDAMPCDDGLTCARLSADPSITLGYCTLPCEDQTCPDGTRCIPTLDRPSGTNKRFCHRECTVPADCEPYGRECTGSTDTMRGICG